MKNQANYLERAFYHGKIDEFLKTDTNKILGLMGQCSGFDDLKTQRSSWYRQIDLLKKQLVDFPEGYIVFEYTIPRLGSRMDVVCIIEGVIFILEFKVGAKDFLKTDRQQVQDYCLDLQNFHQESTDRVIIPMLVSTAADSRKFSFSLMKNRIIDVIESNGENIGYIIEVVLKNCEEEEIQGEDWVESRYSPTPTIIEAAQAMYHNHSVEDISRVDGGTKNLTVTTDLINRIIDYSKAEGRKSICFITGVPGAGKTLAGLNIANERHEFKDEEHAVLLSGNQPLVEVLQEALAQDIHSRENVRIGQARSKVKSFIQIVHHFRDDCLTSEEPPFEKVVIFDEAQRAWDKDQTSDFMRTRKNVENFNKSEPEFLIESMNRHKDWAVLVCLIGGGQEINTGEAGLVEWFHSLQKRFNHWDVYISDKIKDDEYTWGENLDKNLANLNVKILEELHLSVSMRSFRSENVSEFVKELLDVNLPRARELYQVLKDDYPIYLTRNLNKAKEWIRDISKGTERYGIIASSGAMRLRAKGIWMQHRIDPKHWFLGDDEDVRSSYFLEEVASEFDVQGLELDYTIVAWDANFRFVDGSFKPFNFRGRAWNNVNIESRQRYLKNSYRVLLTRARQGMVIYVPNGCKDDKSRNPEYYNGTYEYLKSIGIEEI